MRCFRPLIVLCLTLLLNALLTSSASSQTIRREYWTGIAGTTIGDLQADPNYPSQPTGVSFEESFEAPLNWSDNYGTHMRGYVHPPQTGDYIFWIASDDQGELYLSTNEMAADRVLIARVPTWVPSQDWNEPRDDTYLFQQSPPIHLEAGRQLLRRSFAKGRRRW